MGGGAGGGGHSWHLGFSTWPGWPSARFGTGCGLVLWGGTCLVSVGGKRDIDD